MGVSLIQVLQVFQMISVDWGPPFTDILRILSVIAFNLDFMKVECVVERTAVMDYFLKVVAFPACIVLYALVCCVMHFARKDGIWQLRKEHTPVKVGIISCTNGIGTFSLMFFISLAIISAEPFQAPQPTPF